MLSWCLGVPPNVLVLCSTKTEEEPKKGRQEVGIRQRRGAEGSPKDGEEKRRPRDGSVRRGWDRWGSRKDFRKQS